MEYDKDKVDEATLALMYLVMWRDGDWQRAWKSFEWATMDRLYQKGWIHDLGPDPPPTTCCGAGYGHAYCVTLPLRSSPYLASTPPGRHQSQAL